jgi:hypothetical protein
MRTIVALVTAALLTLTACTVPADEPTAVQPAESSAAGENPSTPKTFPIKLTAKKATAKKSILSDGGALSCAKVTVKNQADKQVDVNPLYFSLVDTDGEKHDAGDALADYEDQIDTTEIGPGEKVTGMVCAKGKFTPKQVVMTNPLFDEAARAEVG